MLNSCRLHWAPSTFSIMNICEGERWRQSIRRRFFGTTHVPSLEICEPVPSQGWPCRHWAQPPPWSPTVPKSFQLSSAFFMFASSSSFFPWERRNAEPGPNKVPVFFLEQRRSRVRVSTPAPAALESLCGAGSDLLPLPPFPSQLSATSSPCALLGSQLGFRQLGNKAQGSCKSPTRSIFSNDCFSNSFQSPSCCYIESNKPPKT